MGWRFGIVLGLGCAFAHPAFAAAPDLNSAIATIQQVGGLGAGNVSAQEAWPILAAAPASEVPTLLAALDEAKPLSANWLRSAVDAVCEKALADGGKLPNAELEAFALDTEHAPRSRRLAFEWLAKADPTAGDRLIPGLLNDPSVEFRRDAVARLLEQAQKLSDGGEKGDALKQLYRSALGGARDLDQVQSIAGKLKELGEEVDLSRHFGFLYSWYVIGPFDNVGQKGFAVAYPPEAEVNLKGEYPGKSGNVAWLPHTTTDEMGAVDLNAILVKEKGVTGYIASEFVSESEQEVEFRWGTMNATKLWLNGELLASHEVYHSGEDLDQYIAKGTLKPGKNVILMKVCQNEQTENWADAWKVAVRVCDAAGTAILSTDRPEKTPTSGAKL